MATRKHANNFDTTLNGSITNVATSITLTSDTGLPSIGAGEVYRLTITDGTNYEIVEVTDDSSSPTLTVTRGVDGTSGTAFDDGDVVSLRTTADSHDRKVDHASSASDNTVPRHDGDENALQSSGVTIDDSDVMGGITQLNVDNLRLDGNTLSATSGALTVSPASGSALNLDDSNVTVDGGAVDITGDLDVDNINIDGNTISSTDTDGDIEVSPDGSGTVNINSDLNVETASDPSIVLYSDDGLQTSYTTFKDASSTLFQLQKTVASGSGLIDIEPLISDGTGQASFRFFRSTNTAGECKFNIHIGTGSNTSNAAIYGKGGDTFFCNNNGNLAIGGNSPNCMLDVEGDVQCDSIAFDDESELTIATGAITVTSGFHRVDTESDASSDDLDTINGGTTGMLLVLTAMDSARTVVLKDGTGNLALAGDFSLDNVEDTITLIYSGAGSVWKELARSDNGA